jgi:hypothetical protein
MFRIAFIAAALIAVVSSASAQCPGGRCGISGSAYGYSLPTYAAPAAHSALTATPVGNAPSDQFEWRSLPGIGFGWVQKCIPVGGHPCPAGYCSDCKCSPQTCPAGCPTVQFSPGFPFTVGGCANGKCGR